MSEQRFSEIMDRQLDTDRVGEAKRQGSDRHFGKEGDRKARGRSKGNKRSTRRRMQERGAR